jgi:hypothetical protein
MALKRAPHPERDPGLDPGEQSKGAPSAIQPVEGIKVEKQTGRIKCGPLFEGGVLPPVR